MTKADFNDLRVTFTTPPVAACGAVPASGCRLPERTKTVTRDGVTYDMFDPGEWLDQGLTGLRDVDTWLRAVNPHALTQPSAVFSLDMPAAPPATRGGPQ